MEITVESIKDNDDGSCNIVFNIEPEVLKLFASQAIRYALIKAANKVIDDEELAEDFEDSELDADISAYEEEIEILENKLELVNKKNQILYDALNLISTGFINEIELIRWQANESLDSAEKIGK